MKRTPRHWFYRYTPQGIVRVNYTVINRENPEDIYHECYTREFSKSFPPLLVIEHLKNDMKNWNDVFGTNFIIEIGEVEIAPIGGE